MANQHNGTSNLIPMNMRTPEERREIGRKGGLAKGENMRRKRNLKETLMLMLEDEALQEAITAKLVREAQEGNQSIKAFEVIRDTIGLKPTDKIEQTNTNVDLSHLSTDEIKALLNE